MNEIRCPECGSLFSIDESSYASNVLNATAKLIVVYGDASYFFGTVSTLFQDDV